MPTVFFDYSYSTEIEEKPNSLAVCEQGRCLTFKAPLQHSSCIRSKLVPCAWHPQQRGHGIRRRPGLPSGPPASGHRPPLAAITSEPPPHNRRAAASSRPFKARAGGGGPAGLLKLRAQLSRGSRDVFLPPVMAVPQAYEAPGTAPGR